MLMRWHTQCWLLVMTAVLAMASATTLAQTALSESEPRPQSGRVVVIAVPSPFNDAQATRVLEQLATVPADISTVWFSFEGAVGDLPAVTKVAARLFVETSRRYVAVVRGRMDGPQLFLVTACHEIWMQPGSQLGPVTAAMTRDPLWDAEFGAMRSRLRSAMDGRSGRIGLWEKWTTPAASLYVRQSAPRDFVVNLPDGARLNEWSLVQGAGALVLVDRDAVQHGLASLVEPGDLHQVAAGKNVALVDAIGNPILQSRTATPETGTKTGTEAGIGAESATGKKSSVVMRPPLPTTKQKAALITVHGVIDDGIAEHIKLRSADALKDGATLIVFELDTPGGSVGSMVEICKHLASLNGKVMTVAWVPHETISAGSIIALACDYIGMKDNSRLGDCQPILPTQEGYTVAGEKIQSYLRSLVSNFAERCGYPKALLQGMITQEIEVIEIRPLNDADFPLLRARFDSPYVDRRDFESWEHASRFRIVRIVKHGAAKDSSKVDATGKTTGTSISAGELLTLTDRQAREFGIALNDVHSFADLQRVFQFTDFTRHDTTWSIELSRTISAYGAILIALGLLGLMIEMKSPGVGIGGLIALVCFGLYFGANAFIGLAENGEIILFIVGVLLVGVEIFVLPGTFIFGLVGGVAMVAALVLAAQDFVLPSSGSAMETDIFTRNVGGLLLAILGAVVGIVFIARFLPKMPVVGRMFLDAPKPSEIPSGSGVALEPGTLMGAIGEAITDLRPVGKARFGDKVVDVQAKAEFLSTGSRVVVVESHGNRIVVNPL